mmetsp:Transcript_2806/g.6726  ORF Transcript_2806/g.6726 Transcript_2806/m.6726 type:complete len:207 (-) Transcript_2806:3-623(-)
MVRGLSTDGRDGEGLLSGCDTHVAAAQLHMGASSVVPARLAHAVGGGGDVREHRVVRGVGVVGDAAAALIVGGIEKRSRCRVVRPLEDVGVPVLPTTVELGGVSHIVRRGKVGGVRRSRHRVRAGRDVVVLPSLIGDWGPLRVPLRVRRLGGRVAVTLEVGTPRVVLHVPICVIVHLPVLSMREGRGMSIPPEQAELKHHFLVVWR